MAMHALSCHACGEKPGALEDAIRDRIITAATSDPSPQVRRHAAVALGRKGGLITWAAATSKSGLR